MANKSYGPKFYREQGGDRAVVASGGSLDVEDGGEIDIEASGALKIGGTEVTATAAELNKNAGLTKTTAELNLLAAGIAADYVTARGVGAVTGTLTVVTGLATVVAVIASAEDDLDGDALAGVSATIGDQAGTPAAGSVILKAWKVTSDADATMIAASAAAAINWVAVGVV